MADAPASKPGVPSGLVGSIPTPGTKEPSSIFRFKPAFPARFYRPEHSRLLLDAGRPTA